MTDPTALTVEPDSPPADGLSPRMALISSYAARHPGDIAARLRGEEAADVLAVLSPLPAPVAVDILRRLQPGEIGRLLLGAEAEVARGWSVRLDAVVLAVVLGQLADEERRRILAGLPSALAEEVQLIVSFPPGAAGGLMDPRFASFGPTLEVRDALERVRGLGDRRISDLVLADDLGRFEGVVRLQDLVGAAPTELLGAIRNPDAPSILPMAVREDVLALMETHRLTSLPVVDQERRVMGIIRYDGLVTAAKKDAFGNLQAMVGGSAEEGALSPPRVGVRSRLPWLLINLLTAFLAASVVGLFEQTIAAVTALAVMLPVVAGQSGNTGAQALAVTMRGLALREIRVRHLPILLRKEAMVGAFNGLAVAVVTSGGVMLWSGSLGLAGVMFLSMVASMIAASLAGAVIPVVLVRLKRDPAVASSIILTTVTDIAGFFSFLGLATLLMRFL